MEALFGKTMTLLERHLDLRALKHQLLASNAANMETPHYKAFDLVVEKELAKAESQIERQPAHRAAALRGARQGRGTADIQRITDCGPSPRADGNTVDMEKTMADLSENTLMYNVTARLLSRRFAALKYAIQGGER